MNSIICLLFCLFFSRFLLPSILKLESDSRTKMRHPLWLQQIFWQACCFVLNSRINSRYPGFFQRRAKKLFTYMYIFFFFLVAWKKKLFSNYGFSFLVWKGTCRSLFVFKISCFCFFTTTTKKNKSFWKREFCFFSYPNFSL